MKRILSIILSLAMIWIITPDLTVTAFSPTIYAEIINTAAGETAEVKILIKDNPGIISLGLNVQYDTGNLKLTEVKNGEVFPNNSLTSGNDKSVVPYTLLWDDAISVCGQHIGK